MDGFFYEHYSYKLRSGGAVPVGPGRFLAQAFGGDRNKITTWEATRTLPKSDDFIGANVFGLYMQASFQRLPYLSTTGQQLFNGTTTGKTEFIDENQIPGQGGF